MKDTSHFHSLTSEDNLTLKNARKINKLVSEVSSTSVHVRHVVGFFRMQFEIYKERWNLSRYNPRCCSARLCVCSKWVVESGSHWTCSHTSCISSMLDMPVWHHNTRPPRLPEIRLRSLKCHSTQQACKLNALNNNKWRGTFLKKVRTISPRSWIFIGCWLWKSIILFYLVLQLF